MELYVITTWGENMNYPQSTPPSKQAQGLAIAGLVCGIIAFLIVPPLFGILGIVFGGVSWSKGNKLGRIATIVSIAGLIIGMIIGAAIGASNS